MLVKGKEVIGLNVVTVDTGTIVETVDDIAYNPETHRIEALLVESGGLFSSAKAVLMDNVISIGNDAVMVPSSNAIDSVKNLTESVHSIADSNKYLVKTNVLTVDGKELGNVTDIYFDSKTGNVEKMEISQGGLKTLTEGKKSITPADIVTIGADATIVSSYAEMKLEEQGEENGLKGAINDAKDNVSTAAKRTKEVLYDTAESIKERSHDALEETKVRAESASNYLEEQDENHKQQLHNMTEGTKNDFKTTLGDTVDTARDRSSKIVERSEKSIEQAGKKVEIEKKKITETQ